MLYITQNRVSRLNKVLHAAQRNAFPGDRSTHTRCANDRVATGSVSAVVHDDIAMNHPPASNCSTPLGEPGRRAALLGASRSAGTAARRLPPRASGSLRNASAGNDGRSSAESTALVMTGVEKSAPGAKWGRKEAMCPEMFKSGAGRRFASKFVPSRAGATGSLAVAMPLQFA